MPSCFLLTSDPLETNHSEKEQVNIAKSCSSTIAAIVEMLKEEEKR
jgi:hypothetical protein